MVCGGVLNFWITKLLYSGYGVISMKVITIYPNREERRIKGSMTLAELLTKLELDFSNVLVMRNCKVLLNDPNCFLNEDDLIEVFPPIAGG